VSGHIGTGRSEAAQRAVASGHLTDYEQATIDLFRNAAPSVVYITTVSQRRLAFSRYVTEVPVGSGSGFVWDLEGHIVTNLHVVAAGKPRVTLADQSEWEAELVGYEVEKDLAVLRIGAPKDKLTPIRVGRARDLQVGQSVFAIGNPFGLDQTLTTGVVSAVGREILSLDRRPIRDVIQTDAAINPGNSGGPLLDSSGRLIGVNTQIYSPSGASAGIGFAIPVDTVNWVVPDLIAFGETRRPQLGVRTRTVPLLEADGHRRRALLVTDVVPGLGAERAGIRAHNQLKEPEIGDVILAVNGEPTETFDDLVLSIESYRDGDSVTLEILRGERKVEVEVELSVLRPRSR
jgi:S1-C subfamily serine protease